MTWAESHQVVAALVRRDDEILLVYQQGPRDAEAVWALPGGVVESSESLIEALAREVREETGLVTRGPGHLLYVADLLHPTAERLLQDEPPRRASRTIACIFELTAVGGELGPADPDSFILDVQFFPEAEAMTRLASHPSRFMREPIVAYLAGEVGTGAVWCYRHTDDGADQQVACIAGRETEL